MDAEVPMKFAALHLRAGILVVYVLGIDDVDTPKGIESRPTGAIFFQLPR
jgi:hypothetical protein